MKKLYLLILCFSIYLLISPTPVNASNTASEVYGLLSSLKAVKSDKAFDLNAIVSSNDFNTIINSYFGIEGITKLDPTNSDAVQILAAYAPTNSEEHNSITEFKDFGFIQKSHRAAYKKMCSAGYLDKYNKYLNPYKSLTYENLFLMLSNYENYIAKTNDIQMNQGIISDVFSSNNNIIIKQRTDSKNYEYIFPKEYTFQVHENGNVSPYSFNLKRGQKAKFYLINDKIVFVNLYENTGPLDDGLEINKGKIYICNEYDKELILKNDLNDYYTVLSYDNPIVYEGINKLKISDINTSFLDRNCYYIKDKNTNKLQYINITG